jgi:hypothetical protein
VLKLPLIFPATPYCLMNVYIAFVCVCERQER